MNKAKSDEIARDFIAQWEGLRLEAYHDVGGVLTIGFGHTGDVRAGDKIGEDEAKALLLDDMAQFIRAVDGLVIVPLNENQRAALISFTFNVGRTAFRTSTLLKRLNRGDYEGVQEELARWNKVDGAVVRGLVNRRKAEADLWRKPAEAAPRSKPDQETPPPIPPDIPDPEPEPAPQPAPRGLFHALIQLLRRIF